MSLTAIGGQKSKSLDDLPNIEKLTDQKICELLKKVIRFVSGNQGNGTGFYLPYQKKIYFITSSQFDPDDGGLLIHPNYFASRMELDPNRKKISEDHNILISEFRDDFIAGFPLAPKDFPIAEGTKIYTMGYPEEDKQPVFHRGYISSVEENTISGIKTRTFTIDKPIPEGQLGSPIAVKINNQLHLIGMLTSDNAQEFTEDAFEVGTEKGIKNIIQTLKRTVSKGGKGVDIRLIHTLLSKGPLQQDLSEEKSQGFILKEPFSLDFWKWSFDSENDQISIGVTIALPWRGEKVTYRYTDLDIHYEDIFEKGAKELSKLLLKIPKEFEFSFLGQRIKARKIQPFWNAKYNPSEVEIPFYSDKSLTYKIWSKPSDGIGGLDVCFPFSTDRTVYKFEHSFPDESQIDQRELYNAAETALLEKYKEIPKEFSFAFEQKLIIAKFESATSYLSSS